MNKVLTSSDCFIILNLIIGTMVTIHTMFSANSPELDGAAKQNKKRRIWSKQQNNCQEMNTCTPFAQECLQLKFLQLQYSLDTRKLFCCTLRDFFSSHKWHLSKWDSAVSEMLYSEQTLSQLWALYCSIALGQALWIGFFTLLSCTADSQWQKEFCMQSVISPTNSFFSYMGPLLNICHVPSLYFTLLCR